MSKILSSLVQRSRFVNWSLIQSQSQIISRTFSKDIKSKGNETRDIRKRRTLKSLQDKLTDITKGKSPLKETSDSSPPSKTVYSPRVGATSGVQEGDTVTQKVESEDQNTERLPPVSTVPHDMFKVKIEGPQVMPSEYPSSQRVLPADEQANQTNASLTSKANPDTKSPSKANVDPKSSPRANMEKKPAGKQEITPVGGTKNFFRVTNVVQKTQPPPPAATEPPKKTGTPTTQPKAELKPNLKAVQDEAAKNSSSDAKTTPTPEASTTTTEAKTTTPEATVDSIITTPKSNDSTPKK